MGGYAARPTSIRVRADHFRRFSLPFRITEAWSRPILKRSASYRAMDVRKAAYVSSASQSQSFADLPELQSQSDPSRRNVSIPQPVAGGFKVAPRSLLSSSVDAGGDSGSGGDAMMGGDERFRAAMHSRERLNAFKRKAKESKR